MSKRKTEKIKEDFLEDITSDPLKADVLKDLIESKGTIEIDFKQFVKPKKSKTDKANAKVYIGPVLKNSEEYKTIVKAFGTSSASELMQIVAGIAKGLNSGTIRLEQTK